MNIWIGSAQEHVGAMQCAIDVLARQVTVSVTINTSTHDVLATQRSEAVASEIGVALRGRRAD